MKKVLITGANSFVGTSVERWLLKESDKYIVDTLDMRDDKWEEKDFSDYDSIVHVAGIAHVSSDPKLKDLYYRVNRDLTIKTAKKAKSEGVKQFIFMSSIIVYGDSISTTKIIDRNTKPVPSNFYGDSKLQAEKGILPLQQNDIFKIAIIRPPVIYGKGSKGNYPKLAKAAQKLPIFPLVENHRSMLHIDNLCEFIKLLIDNQSSGLLFPQNEEYVNVSDLVYTISDVHGKKIKLTKIFNPPLRILGHFTGFIDKVFGNLVYEKSMSKVDDWNYQIRNFKESIELTEK